MPQKKTTKPSIVKEEERTCQKCYKVFKTINILRIHAKREHDNQTYHPCDQCRKSFKTKYYLKTHKTRLHSQQVYAKCDRCDKSFKTKDTYNSHMIQVHTDGTFVCDECRKCFKSKWYLLKHIQSVHCNIRYTCNVCKKNVKYKHLLQSHYDNQHDRLLIDDKSFKITTVRQFFNCQHCPRKFECEKFLYSHTKKKHGVIKSRPSCRGIEKKSYENLKVKSEPESDDSIDIADIEFELDDFNNDKTNEVSYFVCDYCQRKVKYIDSLRRHIKTFHSEIFYSCNICKTNIKNESLLQEHNDVFHGGKIVDKKSFVTKTICKVNNVNSKSNNAKSSKKIKNKDDAKKNKLAEEKDSIYLDDIDRELKKEFGVDEIELETHYMSFELKKEIKSEIEDNYDIDVGPVTLQRPDVNQIGVTQSVVD